MKVEYGDIVAIREAASGIMYPGSRVLWSRNAAGKFRVYWLNLARFLIAEYRKDPNVLDYRIAHASEFSMKGNAETGYVADFGDKS